MKPEGGENSAAEEGGQGRVPCWVYRSNRREETYLYVAEPDRFTAVPEPLLRLLRPLELVMELDLGVRGKLAREDIAKVVHNLRVQGFHLQLPPTLDPKIYRGE